jgi:hypothetical protein
MEPPVKAIQVGVVQPDQQDMRRVVVVAEQVPLDLLSPEIMVELADMENILLYLVQMLLMLEVAVLQV